MLVFINVAVFLGIALIYQSQKGNKNSAVTFVAIYSPKIPTPTNN